MNHFNPRTFMPAALADRDLSAVRSPECVQLAASSDPYVGMPIAGYGLPFEPSVHRWAIASVYRDESNQMLYITAVKCSITGELRVMEPPIELDLKGAHARKEACC